MEYTLERAYFKLENLLDSGDQQIGNILFVNSV